jgi:signal transduction histidine kinase
LLSNAFKYSPAGGKIELSVSSKKDQIEITVSDEGIGIPGEDMIHLFEPFHRSANTVEIPGTGLGLSIVKHAVELHKGKITVKSSLGKGTTFTVDIPKRKK